MYVLCKEGFVTAVRWNGVPIEFEEQQAQIDTLLALDRPDTPILIVRARDEDALEGALRHLDRKPKVFRNAEWDYRYRAYVTAEEWAAILAALAREIDYPDFKTWTMHRAPHLQGVAAAIWKAAREEQEKRNTRFVWKAGDFDVT